MTVTTIVDFVLASMQLFLALMIVTTIDDFELAVNDLQCLVFTPQTIDGYQFGEILLKVSSQRGHYKITNKANKWVETDGPRNFENGQSHKWCRPNLLGIEKLNTEPSFVADTYGISVAQYNSEDQEETKRVR